jgi:hypothetical protein
VLLIWASLLLLQCTRAGANRRTQADDELDAFLKSQQLNPRALGLAPCAPHALPSVCVCARPNSRPMGCAAGLSRRRAVLAAAAPLDDRRRPGENCKAKESASESDQAGSSQNLFTEPRLLVLVIDLRARCS